MSSAQQKLRAALLALGISPNQSDWKGEAGVFGKRVFEALKGGK